jgi:hypothetical protein
MQTPSMTVAFLTAFAFAQKVSFLRAKKLEFGHIISWV